MRSSLLRRLPPILAAFTCFVAIACENTVKIEPNQSGGNGGSGGADGGTGGVPNLPTECRADNGVQICGGKYQCSPTDPGCEYCLLFPDMLEANEVGFCVNQALGDWHSCYLCEDGRICATTMESDTIPNCVPWEIGPLFTAAGASHRLRYADHSAWTGAPLPEPDTCPVLQDVPLCGANCGGCAAGEVCTGRSPLHPYGICASSDISISACNTTTEKCKAGQGCFIFSVQSEHQAEADANGYCLSEKACLATAAMLPGGGKCELP